MTTVPRARERMTDEEKVAKWRPLILAATPKGRFLSSERICEAVNEAIGAKPYSADELTEQLAFTVLNTLAREGTVYLENRERTTGFARPSPTLIAKRREAEAKRKKRDEHEAKESEAEARFMEAMGGGKDVEVGYGDGFSVSLPAPMLAELLRACYRHPAANALADLIAIRKVEP